MYVGCRHCLQHCTFPREWHLAPALILEDDMVVAEAYFPWLTRALCAYGNATALAGVSLQRAAVRQLRDAHAQAQQKQFERRAAAEKKLQNIVSSHPNSAENVWRRRVESKRAEVQRLHRRVDAAGLQLHALVSHQAAQRADHERQPAHLGQARQLAAAGSGRDSRLGHEPLGDSRRHRRVPHTRTHLEVGAGGDRAGRHQDICPLGKPP